MTGRSCVLVLCYADLLLEGPHLTGSSSRGRGGAGEQHDGGILEFHGCVVGLFVYAVFKTQPIAMVSDVFIMVDCCAKTQANHRILILARSSQASSDACKRGEIEGNR